jgi:TatD DNase family protein
VNVVWLHTIALWYDLQAVNYIDTHIHLDLLDDPETLLAEARKANVGAWVMPGVSSERWPELMATAERFENVYMAPGIHPQAATHCCRHHVAEMARLLEHPKAVAIGEVGLDRQVATPWQEQEAVFVRMIHLAQETDKPLLIHTRRRTERILELLHYEGAGRVRGIFHAFSGSMETACKVVDAGFALGIGGVITFATARRLPQVVKEIPAEALVLETDAPDLTPEPYCGQTNRPAYLGLIAEQVAELRGWSLEETARITSGNASRILGLPRNTFEHDLKGNANEHPWSF